MTLAAKYTGLIVGLLVLGVAFRLLERRRPKQLRLPLVRRGFRTDIGFAAVAPLVDKLLDAVLLVVVVVPLAVLVYGGVKDAPIMGGFGPLSRLPLWLQAVLMLILSDFIGYWVHRLFHGRRLWPFHAVHHSSVDLDWLSSLRGHPVNELANKIAGAAPLLGLGFAPTALTVVLPFITVFTILLHANVDWDWGPLRSVIASPRFHRWHHSIDAQARDKNFAGSLPVWDVVFGTYHMPAGQVPRMFGTETPVPDGLVAQLAFPFRRGGASN